jgi:hypothetical protein
MVWKKSIDGGITWNPWVAMPSTVKHLTGNAVVGNFLNHLVHIVRPSDQLMWRYYYNSVQLGWNSLKISTNKFTYPLLLMGWNNDTAIDSYQRRFDSFGIGTDNLFYQNAWDYQGPSWSTISKKTGLTGVGGATIFSSVDPANGNIEPKLRVFVLKLDGTLWQATRTWSNRKSALILIDWVLLSSVSLTGPELCRRPVAYSNAGIVTLYSIGTDGALYTTSFSAV